MGSTTLLTGIQFFDSTMITLPFAIILFLVAALILLFIGIVGLLAFWYFRCPESVTLALASIKGQNIRVEHHDKFKRATLVREPKTKEAYAEKKTEDGIIFPPKEGRDVERTTTLNWTHTLADLPISVSPLDAAASEQAIKSFHRAGVETSIQNIDAIIRADLDPSKMQGYFEYDIEVPAIDEDGNPLFDEETGDPLVLKERRSKVAQIKTEEDFIALQALSDSLKKTPIHEGYFNWNHIRTFAFLKSAASSRGHKAGVETAKAKALEFYNKHTNGLDANKIVMMAIGISFAFGLFIAFYNCTK